MQTSGWFWVGIGLWALSWVLPAGGLGAEGVDLGTIRGHRAFKLAWELAWEGNSASGDVAYREMHQRRSTHGDVGWGHWLPWTWALNLAIPLALLLRRTPPLWLAVALFVCTALAMGWWLKMPRELLLVGYYAWAASFALTGVGVLRSRDF